MPKLFLIRHAIAEDRLVFQKKESNDDLRPLTAIGRNKIKKIAQKLHSLHPKIDILLQSPLVRSQQTVEVLKSYYNKAKIETLANLSPGASPQKLLQDLNKYHSKDLALVGHENDLSQFLFYLLTGKDAPSPFSFKKGGIACLQYNRMTACEFSLQWLASPKIWLD